MYLLSPLHTGGTTQEGNLVGIARESHTNFPYIPSSSIRGRLRASVKDKDLRIKLFGPELTDLTSSPAEGDGSSQLTQGDIWIGDGSLLWIPVPSLSHGVVWVSCPMLLRRWAKICATDLLNGIPEAYSTSLNKKKSPIYLKDAIIKDGLKPWEEEWKKFIPQREIERVLLLPDQHCATLIQMSMWRQVKVKLDEHKVVDGGFRYEEAIPPDTLMYFPWGVTVQGNGEETENSKKFKDLVKERDIFQIGGQESLGRGFVELWQEGERKS